MTEGAGNAQKLTKKWKGYMRFSGKFKWEISENEIWK